jgi:uncharacterized protein
VAAGDVAAARLLFGVTDAGNFEGHNVLHVARTASEVATALGEPAGAVRDSIDRARVGLLEARRTRVRPGLDHKVVASWNGLAIRAFAEAGAVLNHPGYIDDARNCARFVLEHMTAPDGRILRSWSEGEARIPGFLEDHAAVAVGLFTLYQATGELEWYTAAERITRLIPRLFGDPAGGFFTTAGDGPGLVKRPKDQLDNPLPSGNSLAAEALLWLSMYTGDGDAAQASRETIRAGSLLLDRYPLGVGHLAAILASIHRGTREVAVVGDDLDPFIEGFWSAYRPHAVLATSHQEDDRIPLLFGRSPDGQTRAFVCEGFVCNAPVTDPDRMVAQLG